MLAAVTKSSRRTSKLDLDYRAETGLGQLMQRSENRERIHGLCTGVGMLMEDASVTALTIASVAETELATVLEQLRQQVSQMQPLLEVASTLIVDG